MTVDEYFAKLSPEQRVVLAHVRSIAKANIPDATELICYGMPGFKYRGAYVCGYAAFKNHFSFFPTSEPIETLQEQLKDFKTARGTIQFSQNQPLPDELIKQLIAIRVASIDSKG